VARQAGKSLSGVKSLVHEYVDRLVGDLVAHLRAPGAYEATTVVILSHHGFRFGGRERDPLHVLFTVKLAGRQKRVDVTSASRSELLLKEIVERSSAAYIGAG
jgi:arylsulfatase A-like enzyme